MSGDEPVRDLLPPDWVALARWAALMSILTTVVVVTRIVASPVAAIAAGTSVLCAALAAAHVTAWTAARRRAAAASSRRRLAGRRPAGLTDFGVDEGARDESWAAAPRVRVEAAG